MVLGILTNEHAHNNGMNTGWKRVLGILTNEHEHNNGMKTGWQDTNMHEHD